MKTAIEQLDAMEALVRKLAAYTGLERNKGLSMQETARAIVAELPDPTPPDVLTARKLIAAAIRYGNLGTLAAKTAAQFEEGEADQGTLIRDTLQALRRAREEGPRT